MSSVRARNPGIDLLRGLSIILVVMHHLAIRIPLGRTAMATIAPRWLLSALCWNGAESVVTFFVISGFLITGNALDRWGSLGEPQFRAFFARRAARILPCLVALVAVLSLLDLLHVANYTITRPDQSLAGAVFAALSFHLNWYEAYSGYLPGSWDVLWSLSVEEAFYLGFPVACLLARRDLAPLILLLAILALSLPFAHGRIGGNELLREKAYLPGMASIATGVLAAIAAHRWQPSRRICLSLIAVGGVAWLAVMVAETAIWSLLGEATMLILTFGTAMLLSGLHGSPLTMPRFSAGLQAFGRLSYEVYLTHMFVVFAALALFHAAGLSDRLGWLLYPAVIAASLVVGKCVARTVSQPAEISIKHLLIKPRALRPAGLAVDQG